MNATIDRAHLTFGQGVTNLPKMFRSLNLSQFCLRRVPVISMAIACTGLVISCGGNGNGETTVITQKCEKAIDCTLRYSPEVNGTKTLLFELNIPAGTLEESVEITVVQSEEDFVGMTFTQSYKIQPESLKLLAGKKASLTLGYVEAGITDITESLETLSLNEAGLRIGRRNEAGGFDVLAESGPPQQETNEIDGDITGGGEFSVVYNPIILSVFPESGAPASAADATDGEAITITGYNFLADAEGGIVMFNKVEVDPSADSDTQVSDTQITFKLPALKEGETQEDLKGALTITVESSNNKKRTSNAVTWGFGSSFDAAVYDHALSWGILSTAIANKDTCKDEATSATAKCFRLPWGVAVDQFGCVYVSDTGNHRILKFTGDGTPALIKSCEPFAAATGTTRFVVGTQGSPTASTAATTAAGGTVSRRQTVDPSTLTAADIAAAQDALGGSGDSTSTDAAAEATAAETTPVERGEAPKFESPLGIVVGLDGTIFVADSGNDRVVILTVDTKGAVTVAGAYGKQGTGSATGELDSPSGLALDSSEGIWVVDTNNNRVVRFTYDSEKRTGTEAEVLGPQVDPKEVALGKFDFLGQSLGSGADIAFDPTTKRLYVADPGNFRILYFERNDSGETVTYDYKGTFGTAATGVGTPGGLFRRPVGVAVDTKSFLYVLDSLAPKIEKYNRVPRLFPSTVGNPADRTQYEDPTTMAVDLKANIFVVNRNASKIQKFTPRAR